MHVTTRRLVALRSRERLDEGRTPTVHSVGSCTSPPDGKASFFHRRLRLLLGMPEAIRQRHSREPMQAGNGRTSGRCQASRRHAEEHRALGRFPTAVFCPPWWWRKHLAAGESSSPSSQLSRGSGDCVLLRVVHRKVLTFKHRIYRGSWTIDASSGFRPHASVFGWGDMMPAPTLHQACNTACFTGRPHVPCSKRGRPRDAAFETWVAAMSLFALTVRVQCDVVSCRVVCRVSCVVCRVSCVVCVVCVACCVCGREWGRGVCEKADDQDSWLNHPAVSRRASTGKLSTSWAVATLHDGRFTLMHSWSLASSALIVSAARRSDFRPGRRRACGSHRGGGGGGKKSF